MSEKQCLNGNATTNACKLDNPNFGNNIKRRNKKNLIAILICFVLLLSFTFGVCCTASLLHDSKTATGTIKFDIVNWRSLTFDNATWEQVQYVAEHYGQVGMPTWHVGDTKQIRIYDTASYATAGNTTYSRTHTVRIADIQSGRYTISGVATNGKGKSSGTTNMVFELAEPIKLVSTDTNSLGVWQTSMNSTNTDTNGWAGAELQTTLNSSSGSGIFGRLQTDLQAVIPKVKVHSTIGNATWELVTSSNYVSNRLFLPAACNVTKLSNFYDDEEAINVYGSEDYNFYMMGKTEEGLLYQYYSDDTDAIRKKTYVNKDNGNNYTVTPQWWLRTPYLDQAIGAFLYVASTGIVQTYYASYKFTVSFCWAM